METTIRKKIATLLLVACASTAFFSLSLPSSFFVFTSLPPPRKAFAKEPLPATQSSTPPASASLNTNQFVLVMTDGKFGLQFGSRGKKKQISLPRAWLVPPAEEKDEENSFVSSFDYDKRITSFAIGNGEIGLHLSSFGLMTEGSAKAAAGRDLFLLYDPRASVVHKGLTALGVTKARERDAGCFSAQTTHFLLADIDKDGLSDIGLVREVIECQDVSTEREVDRPARPVYSQQPVEWHIFGKGRWRIDSTYRGAIPNDSTTLPLIGMTISPVDFVGYGYWKSHDPAKWGVHTSKPVPYEPPYRRQLIENDARARRDTSTIPQPEIHAVTSGRTTAHFGGEKLPADTPLEYGISALWFTFADNKSIYVFKPAGELFFSDWRFDLFSPDGAYVLLLQDHYGPYHIVSTDRLEDYLRGWNAPDQIVTKATTANQPALVHSEGRWVTPREIKFVVTCCGTKEIITFRLP